ALANAEPVRWELFRLTLGHAYDLRKDDWAEAFATLIVAPTPRVRFRSDLTYDPSANNVPSVTADIQTEIPRGALNAGFRYSDPAKITFLQGGFSVSPWAWLTTRGTINWDLYTTTFVENRLAFDLHWQCWALSIELINRAHRARRRARRRGAHAGVLLRRLRHHHRHGRGHAGLRGRRAGHPDHGPRRRHARAHPAYEGRDAGAPVRPPRGHRPHRGVRAGA